MKNLKLYVGLSLLVQSFSLLIACIVSMFRKKTSGGALFAASALTGAAGSYLVYKEMKKKSSDEMDFGKEDFDDFISFDDEEECGCDECDCEDCNKEEKPEE